MEYTDQFIPTNKLYHNNRQGGRRYMITPYEPKVSLTARYPIGMAAELLGLHRNTLRRYAQTGLIKTGTRRIGKPSLFFLGSELLRFWKAEAGRRY